MNKLQTYLVAGAVAVGGLAVTMAVAPESHACAPVNVQGGGWGGTRQECLPDGSMYICDNGWAPFVGRIENCFWAPKGHPRNP
ncbi:membrane protein [Mycobacterium phage ScoobyDoobyDoo]|nr:membrane protein [Mycobacterium phage ScoobyDoobyDoo]